MDSPQLLLESERVGLGPLRRDLLATYVQWDNDLELSALRGTDPRPKVDGARDAWLDGLIADEKAVFFTVYETVFEHKAPRPVGLSMLLGISRVDRTADLGVYLGERDTWGTGLGTEAVRLTLDFAFTALGLHNVLLRVAAANTRAVRAYEKAGFRLVGRRRGSYRLGARALDELYMDCVADEFESPVLARRYAAVLPDGGDDGAPG